MNKLIYVCSPYRGDIRTNTEQASQVQNVGVNFSFVKFIGLVFLAFMLHSLDHDSPHFVYG